MLFPRAHAVSILYQSCLVLAVSPCTYKRLIEAARPQQTPLWGLAQMPDNRPAIMHDRCGLWCSVYTGMWKWAYVCVQKLLWRFTKKPFLWCRSTEFSSPPQSRDFLTFCFVRDLELYGLAEMATKNGFVFVCARVVKMCAEGLNDVTIPCSTSNYADLSLQQERKTFIVSLCGYTTLLLTSIEN